MAWQQAALTGQVMCWCHTDIQIAALTPESWGHNMVVRVLGIEELTGGSV